MNFASGISMSPMASWICSLSRSKILRIWVLSSLISWAREEQRSYISIADATWCIKGYAQLVSPAKHMKASERGRVIIFCPQSIFIPPFNLLSDTTINSLQFLKVLTQAAAIVISRSLINWFCSLLQLLNITQCLVRFSLRTGFHPKCLPDSYQIVVQDCDLTAAVWKRFWVQKWPKTELKISSLRKIRLW